MKRMAWNRGFYYTIFLLFICFSIFYSCKKDKNVQTNTSFNDTISTNNSSTDESVIKEDSLQNLDSAGENTDAKAISFDQYPTQGQFTGVNAPIDFDSNPMARQFKTRITKAYQNKSPNFAGYYIFTDWGCGSSCQQSVIIDARDGKVYNGPTASLGYEYKVESRLLVMNPADSLAQEQGDELYHTKYWEWDEAKKVFINLEDNEGN